MKKIITKSTNLEELALEIREINAKNGFIKVSKDSVKDVIVSLALIGTEVSEAIEEVRINNWEGVEEEIADIIIRCLDLSASLGFDMDTAISAKIKANASRPYRHGKLI